jgi:hypothetical protein
LPVRRTWWIVPYFSGMLAVFAVAGLLSLTVLHHSPAKHPEAAATTTPKVQLPLPAQMVTDALFQRLTKDIQTHDETALLTLVAPATRPAVQTWWQNLQAIGYTTGLIIPAGSNSVVDLDHQGDGTITVLAGTHSTFDPSSSQGPDVPCERYQLGLHFASATAIGQITSWKPLGDAPWDEGAKLYVRTAKHVVVAGLPSERAQVNKILPLAETAANFDGALLSHVNANDLHQDGFIVFVGKRLTGTAQFTGTAPAGWPQAYQGGKTVPLPGANGDMTGIATGISAGVTGGGRVLVTPGQTTAQLVRLFMLDILAPDDEGLTKGFAPPTLQPWTLQGIADAVQGLYQANKNPVPAKYNFSALTAEIRALPARYRGGQLPTGKDLTGGTAATRKDWNVVAASVYAYIGSTYGMNQLFGSASLMWTGEPTPFGNVLASGKGGTYTFYATNTVKARWRTWLASR